MIKLTVALFLLFSTAQAHDWYPQNCCGGKDCRPVACSTIVEHADGSVSWLSLWFSADKVQASHDAQCHVCISYYPGGSKTIPSPLCAFVNSTM